MASAFSNNTEKLNSSDRTSNFKAKTNYNYLRLVSLKNVDNPSKNFTGCKNKRFSSSSGNVILGLDDNLTSSTSTSSNSTLSKLVNTRSYALLNSINKGYYLPTTIPKNDTTNNNINRPPYTYDPSCNFLNMTEDEFITGYTVPNTSGDLQEILFNEYLDFGNLTLVTNTQLINDTNNENDNDVPFQTMHPNQIQVTDATFSDYIIDPDNIITNYKDSNLSTYLGLQKEESSFISNNGKKTVLKIINWKKLQSNSFPNNKYHRFSLTEPIKFYNYDACLSDISPPSDFYKGDIRLKPDPYDWQDGKTIGSDAPTGDIALDVINL